MPSSLRRAVAPLVRDLAGSLLHVSGVTGAARQGQGRLSVATFHRVLPEAALREYPLPQIAVTPEELAWFLGYFGRQYTCSTLAAVHRRWLDGEQPARPFLAITFDDGQLDNFEHARPALAAAGLKASFFAPLDAVESNQPLWHDRLGFAAARLLTGDRPAALELFGALGPVEGADAARLGAALQRAKRLEPSERLAFVARLEARLGHPARPAWDGLMSWDQLRTLAGEGHEVGSHSVSHAILPLVDDAQLAREVAGSRARLEAELQRPCESFCYPNGDCDERVVAAVRQAGYRRAVVTAWGANAPGADPLRLTRFDMQGRHSRDRHGRLSEARLAFRMSRLFPGAAPVRIAYLVSQYPAPSHTFIRREVAALRARGVAVDTCSIRLGESLSEADRAEEARTFVVLAPPGWRAALRLKVSLVATFLRRPRRWLATLAWTLGHRLPGPANLLRSLVYFAEAMHLARELERRGTTHVHDHFANPAAVAGAAAARLLGLGWSVTLHGHSDFHGPTTPLLPAKIAEARFVATVSHFGRGEALRLAGAGAADKIHVVRCGIEPGLLPPPAHRPPGSGPLEILSVGRLSPEKGQTGLVEAFATAVRRGVDARLVLIGGGPEEGRVRAAVAAHGLGERVELRGRQPEAAVLEAMARADLFALSSLMEGLPVVLMEALALRLPVIAPALTGIPELVVHGETGLLFPAGDWAALAEALVLLAGDAALRARLAEAGRIKVLAEFDAARAVEPLVGLFQAAHAPLGRALGASLR